VADEIERSIARWRAQRPALDTVPLALSARVIRSARLLEIGRREALAARDLEVWEFDVLAALRASGSDQQLSPSALMAATQVASGTVTNRIDRLLQRGFVSREPDPDDRRSTLVRLTVAGRRRIDAAAAELASAERLTWEALPARKRDQLSALLREFLHQVEG
jgi:DNA-binding MarR family transcriptional regulator